VHPGQHRVQEDEVGPALAGHPQRLLAVPGLQEGALERREDLRLEDAHLLVVVHEQHALARRHSGDGRGCGAGGVTEAGVGSRGGGRAAPARKPSSQALSSIEAGTGPAAAGVGDRRGGWLREGWTTAAFPSGGGSSFQASRPRQYSSLAERTLNTPSTAARSAAGMATWRMTLRSVRKRSWS
jgi:hypothetical protein